MRLLTRLIPWSEQMTDQSETLARIRKAAYSLEDLPETIDFPQHPAQETNGPMPVVDATLDDIAFAIIAADQESSAVYRRAAALQRLYKLAREAGGIGTDNAVTMALKREKR